MNCPHLYLNWVVKLNLQFSISSRSRRLVLLGRIFFKAASSPLGVTAGCIVPDEPDPISFSDLGTYQWDTLQR